MENPEEFGNILLRSTANGATVKLSDVARIEVGNQDYGFMSRQDGKPTVGTAIQLSPGLMPSLRRKPLKIACRNYRHHFQIMSNILYLTIPHALLMWPSKGYLYVS